MLTVEWRNPLVSLDVNADGHLAPIDALRVINELNDPVVTGQGGLLPSKLSVPQERFSFLDVSGDGYATPVDALQVINALNEDEELPIALREDHVFATERQITVGVGASTGGRTYRFDIDAQFDRTDTTASLKDALAVYLVSETDRGTALLDQGRAGSALFVLREDGADYLPGLVRFDGRTVEIDVSSITGTGFGRLVFQALGSDSDTGTSFVITPTDNELAPQGIPSPRFPASKLVEVGGPRDIAGWNTPADVLVHVENPSFNPVTQRFAAEFQVESESSNPARSMVVAFPSLPSGVQLVGRYSTDGTGLPYVNVGTLLDSGGLQPGVPSAKFLVEFTNPNNVPLDLHPQVLSAGTNNPPTLAPVGPLTVSAGGVLDLTIQATDIDDDQITIRLKPQGPLPALEFSPAGRLIVRPKPGEEGEYHFTLIASDGSLEVSQLVTIMVPVDPNTHTRISGIVKQTNDVPLANVRIDIGAIQGLTASDGSFTLDLGAGAVISDTIKIRGDLVSAPSTLPFIAEKLALALEHDVYPGVNNVISRPIYLPLLDLANSTPIDPTKDTTVTTSAIPGASVFVKKGTLQNLQGTAFTGNLSVTEVPVALTPIALPDNLRPDLVVTIQPGEMVFASPAPLTLPNRAHWPVGTTMDLWSINPSTGVFEDVGNGVVSADGTQVVTTTGGIHNSSWHFFTPPTSTVPNSPSTNPNNPDDSCPNDRGMCGFTSSVELHSGVVAETHDLASYDSAGETRMVSLRYDSLRADPRHIVHLDYPNLPPNSGPVSLMAKLSASFGTVKVNAAGLPGGSFGLSGGENFWDYPDAGGAADVALQLDLTGLPSGVYDYTWQSGAPRFDGVRYTGTLTTSMGSLVHVDGSGSPFGVGWSVVGLQTLSLNPNGAVLLVDGNGTQLSFAAPAALGGPFRSPPGDFSTLVKLPTGEYLRTLKDQTSYLFDTSLRLVKVSTAKGLTTRYEYIDQGISRIIDPVGLTTAFGYAQGHVVSITDPAGRVTELSYDSDGNLARVTDPDHTSRKWLYDVQHHIIQETNKNGFVETTHYDQFGRASEATRTDGSHIKLVPPEVIGLYSPERTQDHLDPPVSRNALTANALYVQTDGSVSRYNMNSRGEITGGIDGFGDHGATIYSGGQIIASFGPDFSRTTLYDYDSLGNVRSVSDSVFGPVGALQFQNGASASIPHNDVFDDIEDRDEVTIEAWIRIFGYPQDYFSILDKYEASSDFGWTLQISSHGELQFVPGLGPSAVASWNPEMHRSYHVAFSYKRSNGYAEFLIDGQLLQRVPFSEDIHDTFGEPLYLGFNPSGGNEYSSGMIDELRIWKRALSSEEIARHFATVLRGNENDLVAYWQFDEGGGGFYNGTTFSDKSPSHLTGTLGASRPTWVPSSAGIGQFFRFDPTYSILVDVHNELGYRTLQQLDPATGNVLNRIAVVGLPDTAANGQTDDEVTAFTYSTLGLVASVTDPRGFVTAYDYDNFGRLVRVTSARGTSQEATRTFEYDPDTVAGQAGLATQITDENGHHTDYEYDALNRVTAIRDHLGNETRFEYDASGAILLVRDARNVVTRYERDKLGRVIATIDANSQASRIAYDANGNIVAQTDPLGHTTRSTYDSRGRKTSAIDPDGGKTTYTYDKFDNLASLTDPVGNMTQFFYDKRDRVVRERDPLGKDIVYSYDAANNLISKLDRNSRLTAYVYDDRNRLSREIWVGASVEITSSYDKVGNLLTAVSPESALAFTYDAHGWMATADNAGTPNAPHVVLSYTHDLAGNVTSVIDTIDGVAGATTSYAYDSLDRLSSLSQTGANVAPKLVDFLYNELGQFTEIRRYGDLARTSLAVDTTYRYDALNRLDVMTHKRSDGSTISFFDLNYDAASRITQITDIDGVTNYGYDKRDQLTSADHSDPQNSDGSYQYDANGNRISSHLSSSYVTGPANRLQADGTYTYEYDNEGNLTKRTETASGSFREFKWDFRGRLTDVIDKTADGVPTQVARYTYDSLNRRIAKSLNATPLNAVPPVVTTFVYDREDIILDFVDSLGLTGNQPLQIFHRYLHGSNIDEVLASDENAGDAKWLLSDQLGSICDSVDFTSLSVIHTNFESFGLPSGDSRVSGIYGFAGREQDNETEMNFNRARFVDPSTGRFLSEDGLRFTQRDLHLYRYARNSPLSFTDPWGYDAGESVTDGVLEFVHARNIDKESMSNAALDVAQKFTFDQIQAALSRAAGRDIPAAKVLDVAMKLIEESNSNKTPLQKGLDAACPVKQDEMLGLFSDLDKLGIPEMVARALNWIVGFGPPERGQR